MDVTLFKALKDVNNVTLTVYLCKLNFSPHTAAFCLLLALA